MGGGWTCAKCILSIVIMRSTNLRSLDLNLLVLLDALIEHRGVTRAAEAMHLSQPAMSRALGRLRAMLDDPILARGADGLVATPRALALQGRLRLLLTDIAALVAAPAFVPADWTAEVTIAATDQQTLVLLPRLMARLSLEAPHLDVRIVPLLSAMVDELRDGRIHLAFGIEGQALGPGLRSEALYPDRFVTLLRRGHPAGAAWSRARFARLDHVLVTVLGQGPGAIDDALARVGLSRRIALRVPHFRAAMEVVARSDLIVTLPRSVAEAAAEALGLVWFDPPLPTEPFTVALLWPEVLDADPGAIWLRGVVAAEARLSVATPH